MHCLVTHVLHSKNKCHCMKSAPKQHHFSDFIRILGKGKKGSRALTQKEAYSAMRMIMTGEVLPVQLGAFLMLMRVKEETPQELAGFVKAARESFSSPSTNITVDLDWSSYAGKRRHLPWFIFSTLLLAKNGISVLMHGASGHTDNRIYTENILKHLGIPLATSLEQAAEQIRQNRFSYISLEHFAPRLHEIIELRPLMGLRSPVHTLVRLLNPFNSSYSLQGIFHPGYRPVHQEAALLLEQPHMAVLKGEGGETERNPDMPCVVQSVHNGELSDEEWPALFKRRHVKPEVLDPDELVSVWQGKTNNEFAEATITGTTAIALKLLNKAGSRQEAEDLAHNYWMKRPKHHYGFL